MICKIYKDWPENGVQSPTTPEVTHKRPEAYLAEVMMLNRGTEAKPYFWRDTKNLESYKGFLIHLANHLKFADFGPLCKVIIEKNLTSLTGEAIELIAEEILRQNTV